MKRITKVIFALALLILPAFSFAKVESIDRGYREKIDTFAANIKLNSDGTSDITEKIVYDFGNNEKHGIFRVIPTFYKFRNGDPHQRISNFSVTDGFGVKQLFKKDFSLGKATFVIGDENKLVSGVKTYIVNYKVSNTINSKGIFDEFYWNSIGDGWDESIENAILDLELPPNVALDKVTFACFAGSFGSNRSCTGERRESNHFIFTHNDLSPHQAMTLKFDFPPGTFPGPSKLELFVYKAPWPWILPIIFAFIIVYVWWKYGKDPEGRGTIVPFYEPPKDMTPLEASLLLKVFSGAKKGLAAEIIFLATRGYIKITRIPKKGILGKDDYEIKKINKDTSSLSRHDGALIDGLLIGDGPTKISEVKETFYSYYKKVNDETFEAAKKKGYFKYRPASVILIYIGVASGLTFLLGFWGAYLFSSSSKILPFLLPGLILFVFSFIMPKRTKLGSEVREELLGLKMYIRAAEADRIRFHNEPKKDPKKFEELLPYAIVFGLEKEWAKQFEGIYTKEPGWYAGDGYAFSAIALTNQINTFSSYTNVNIASSSSSSGGGGFAGGGGGGGGGGSW